MQGLPPIAGPSRHTHVHRVKCRYDDCTFEVPSIDELRKHVRIHLEHVEAVYERCLVRYRAGSSDNVWVVVKQLGVDDRKGPEPLSAGQVLDEVDGVGEGAELDEAEREVIMMTPSKTANIPDERMEVESIAGGLDPSSQESELQRFKLADIFPISPEVADITTTTTTTSTGGTFSILNFSPSFPSSGMSVLNTQSSMPDPSQPSHDDVLSSQQAPVSPPRSQLPNTTVETHGAEVSSAESEKERQREPAVVEEPGAVAAEMPSENVVTEVNGAKRRRLGSPATATTKPAVASSIPIPIPQTMVLQVKSMIHSIMSGPHNPNNATPEITDMPAFKQNQTTGRNTKIRQTNQQRSPVATKSKKQRSSPDTPQREWSPFVPPSQPISFTPLSPGRARGGPATFPGTLLPSDDYIPFEPFSDETQMDDFEHVTRDRDSQMAGLDILAGEASLLADMTPIKTVTSSQSQLQLQSPAQSPTTSSMRTTQSSPKRHLLAKTVSTPGTEAHPAMSNTLISQSLSFGRALTGKKAGGQVSSVGFKIGTKRFEGVNGATTAGTGEV